MEAAGHTEPRAGALVVRFNSEIRHGKNLISSTKEYTQHYAAIRVARNDFWNVLCNIFGLTAIAGPL